MPAFFMYTLIYAAATLHRTAARAKNLFDFGGERFSAV